MHDGIERSPDKYFRRHNSAHPEMGGCRKDSGGKHKGIMRDELMARRENWAQLQNAYLEKHGHAARVDPRSNKDRGIEQEAERHLGPAKIKRMTEVEKESVVALRVSGTKDSSRL
jgi:hypothetical protein